MKMAAKRNCYVMPNPNSYFNREIQCCPANHDRSFKNEDAENVSVEQDDVENLLQFFNHQSG